MSNTIYKKYHYTYWITNIKEEKYYIGVRSCNTPPLQDLGIKYFGSKYKDGKLDRGFIHHQKINQLNFEYRIIGIFPTREISLLNEIEIHEIYDIAKNSRFYNGSKQTSIKFNTSGTELSEETKIKCRVANLGKGKIIQQFTTEYILIKEGTINIFIGDNIIKRLIYNCCNGKQKTHQGFIWKYKDDNNFTFPLITKSKNVGNKNNLGKGKIIQQLSSHGVLLKENTINYFIEEGFYGCNISLCANGKRKSHKNFIWKYKSQEKNN